MAFREHTALANVRSKGKPLLFTKGDLASEDSAALSIKVRDAIAGNEHRVVAVVINAIDEVLLPYNLTSEAGGGGGGNLL